MTTRMVTLPSIAKLRLVPLIACAVAALVVGGCNQPGAGRPQPTSGASSPGGVTATTTEPPGGDDGVDTAPPPPANEPADNGVTDFKVTYNFAVPSSKVSVNHTVHPPIGGPSDPPLPYLVGIYVGNHPEAAPPYQRMSFYFRGAFPSYNFQYVPQVLSEGQGTPISLQGNAFLRIGFTDAQAHDNNGSTVDASPKNPIGFTNLKSYGSAGDFEGHVTYGLGLQVAAGSDQALKIRSGELKKPDGSGGFYYVIFFDVQNG